MFCHGFDFLSVMQKTWFFEKCGIVYVETEKTPFEYEMYSVFGATSATDLICGTCGRKIGIEKAVSPRCRKQRKHWKQRKQFE